MFVKKHFNRRLIHNYETKINIFQHTIQQILNALMKR